MIFALPIPQLIQIQGNDAIAFAHAQFCNNVLTLQIGTWQYNAWLNPQGRVRAFFALLRPQIDTLILALRGGQAAEICADLARYKFRSNVTIQTLLDWRAHGLQGTQVITEVPDSEDLFNGTPDTKKLLQSPGLLGIAQSGNEPRLLLLTASQPESAINHIAHIDDIDAWIVADIHAGLPYLATATTNEFLPQALGLERLHAVSFNKGCYPGQEVVARVHFKGGNKRHLHSLEFTAEHCSAAGSTIYVIGKDQVVAGILLQCARVSPTHARGLAVLREDMVGQPLYISGVGAISLAMKC